MDKKDTHTHSSSSACTTAGSISRFYRSQRQRISSSSAVAPFFANTAIFGNLGNSEFSKKLHTAGSSITSQSTQQGKEWHGSEDEASASTSRSFISGDKDGQYISKTVRLSQPLAFPQKEDVFTAPAFRYAKFGTSPYSDVLVVFTNAIRQETRDLFHILYCLYERPVNELERGDIKSFYYWYHDYRFFFETCVDALQNVYLPWVEWLLDISEVGMCSMEYFETEAAALQRTVRKTHEYSPEFLGYEPKKASARLRSIFTRFSKRLLGYLSALEKTTMKVTEYLYLNEDSVRLGKVMIDYISKAPRHKKNLRLLAGWMHKCNERIPLWRKDILGRRKALSSGKENRGATQEDCLTYFNAKCRTLVGDVVVGIAKE